MIGEIIFQQMRYRKQWNKLTEGRNQSLKGLNQEMNSLIKLVKVKRKGKAHIQHHHLLLLILNK